MAHALLEFRQPEPQIVTVAGKNVVPRGITLRGDAIVHALVFEIRVGERLQRGTVARPADPSAFSGTARELVLHMPHAFNPEAAPGLKAEIQFDLSGEGGGKIVLSIADGRCMAREGEALSPSLTIKSPSDVWLKIARGEINRPKALMDGLFKVEGDISLLMKIGGIFHAPGQPVGGQETVTEGGRAEGKRTPAAVRKVRV